MFEDQDGSFKRRGRKPKEWKFLVFLLSKANDDFLPSAGEINRLQRCGYVSAPVTVPPPTVSAPVTVHPPPSVSAPVTVHPPPTVSAPVTVHPPPSVSAPVTVHPPPSVSAPVTVPPPPTVSAPVTVPPPPTVSTPVTVPPPPTVSAPVTVPPPPTVSAPVTVPPPLTVSAPVTVPPPPTVTAPATVFTPVQSSIPETETEPYPVPDPVHIADVTDAQMDMSHDSFFEHTPVISFRRRRAASIRARATIRENAAAIMMTSGSSGSASLISSPVSQPTSPLRLNIDSPPRIPPLPSLESSPQASQQSNLDTVLSQLHGLLCGSKPVAVRRDHVVEDMMELYKDTNLLLHMLSVSFEGEEGQDAGGLTKDVFTAFWESAYTKYFSGEDVLVPFIPPHRYCEGISVFPILGRIFCHGIALTGFLPVRISRTVLISIAYGPMVMDEKILLDDFLSFISEHERKLTSKGLDSFDTLTQGETSQLIDMFARFNMAVVPTRNTFQQHVLNLAVCELTGRPSFLCSQMRSGIPDLYQDVFFHPIAKEGLVSLCDRLQPTPSRVADLLRTDHELQPEGDRIYGNVLDLPLEYNTLQEFKREFLCSIDFIETCLTGLRKCIVSSCILGQ
ncbi:COPII coat assembly protein SEC16-like [Pecten maximus]|uniref:COPII coat assembly protein SEC16-like n=1 Tax=Pecten maximus TaxID=6579 RepID=UPI001458C8A3|nr:COPII coat assembly protein SEC16-like [Pecten maximus]